MTPRKESLRRETDTPSPTQQGFLAGRHQEQEGFRGQGALPERGRVTSPLLRYALWPRLPEVDL